MLCTGNAMDAAKYASGASDAAPVTVLRVDVEEDEEDENQEGDPTPPLSMLPVTSSWLNTAAKVA